MKTVIKQGRTVEEAVLFALEDLQVDRNEVEIEVVEEASKGLFGLLGAKPAKVQVTVLANPLETVAQFVQGVCKRMGADVEVSMEDGAESIMMDITGQNLGLLIGKHGQTLNALQYLANVVYNRNAEEHQRLVLDIGGYRVRRQETLTRLAERLAEKAKRTGRRIMLEPMNAQERRIIHTALQGDKHIVTYSEGEEPYRKVVIALR